MSKYMKTVCKYEHMHNSNDVDWQRTSPHLESEEIICSHVHHVANLQAVTLKTLKSVEYCSLHKSVCVLCLTTLDADMSPRASSHSTCHNSWA